MGFRIAAVERHRAPRQRFFLALGALGPAQHSGQSGISRGKHRIEIDRPPEEFFSESVVLGAGLAEMPHSALAKTPGVEACRRLAHRALLLGFRNGRGNGDRRRQGDFILHGKDVGEIAIVAFGPNMLAGLRLDPAAR
jgi:hypothetical protein